MIETDFINLKVNGENITVSTGDRLLHAIKKTQKSVPTLCYDDRIGPQGTCRMCLVEVKKDQNINYVASCTYLAENDIEVFKSELGWREFAYYLLYHFPYLQKKNLKSLRRIFPEGTR